MYAGDVAREIDRIVVGGHAAAGALAKADPPAVLASMGGHPGILNTVGVVLLAGPITRDDLGCIVPYTSPSDLDRLIRDNTTHGVIADLALTAAGREWADAVVTMQDSAVDRAWAGAASAVATVRDTAERVVDRATALAPPIEPAAFPRFAAVWRRPSAAAQALRLVTALRYWRADAHRRALADVDLRAPAAHALNVLWDAHRGITRVGQGSPEASSAGLADLEERGFAADGAITDAGVARREEIEAATDRYTEPVYEDLDGGARDAFLVALRSLAA